MPHTTVGTTLYTSIEIAERALRMIGAFSINDSAPQPEEVAESLYWLDMLIGHVAGTSRRFWLLKDELRIPLQAAVSTYTLSVELAQQITRGVQFPTAAMLEDTSTGRRTPLPIVSQQRFREIVEPGRLGTPCEIFIERLNDPKLFTWPVPQANDVGKTIILTVQTFNDSVKPKGVTGGSGLGNEVPGLKAAWNLWVVVALATLIGNGPVRKLPIETIRQNGQMAAGLLDQLESFENREHDNVPQHVQPSVYA